MTAERARPLTGALLILIGFFALVHAALGAELPAEPGESLAFRSTVVAHADAESSHPPHCSH